MFTIFLLPGLQFLCFDNVIYISSRSSPQDILRWYFNYQSPTHHRDEFLRGGKSSYSRCFEWWLGTIFYWQMKTSALVNKEWKSGCSWTNTVHPPFLPVQYCLDYSYLPFIFIHYALTAISGEVLFTFTILTTDSSSALQWLHGNFFLS